MHLVPPIGLLRQKAPPVPPISAPVHIASSSTANSSSGDPTLTITKPTGTVDGDIMVAFVMGNGTNISTPPSGWTLLFSNSTSLDGTTTYFYCYTKVASSEPASYDWSMSGGAFTELGSISTYRPIHAAQPEDISGGQLSANFNLHTATNITTVHVETLVLVAYFLNRGGGSTSAVLTPPSGMTNRVDQNGSSVGRFDLQLVAYDEVQSAAGLYTGKQLTSNANTWSAGITVGIRALGT